MKTLTFYIAYDDTEFTDETKCRAYEAEAEKYVCEAIDTYSFYDKDMNMLPPLVNNKDIEQFLTAFEALMNICEYVRVNDDVSRELHQFLWHNIGACILDEKGFYKYDWDRNEWVSVD